MVNRSVVLGEGKTIAVTVRIMGRPIPGPNALNEARLCTLTVNRIVNTNIVALVIPTVGVANCST